VTAFAPTAADMEGEYHGLLVASFDPEISADGLIAVGPDITPARAHATFAAYQRDVDSGLAEWTAGYRLAITPTTFTRDADGTWIAHPHTPGAQPAAWLVPSRHPAHSA